VVEDGQAFLAKNAVENSLSEKKLNKTVNYCTTEYLVCRSMGNIALEAQNAIIKFSESS
jgi:hypothetical protein